MVPSSDRSSAHGSVVLSSALAGAVLGAAALTWWLLSETDRRRRNRRPQQGWVSPDLPDGEITVPLREGGSDGQLRDRVQQLNAAIDDVRRQLEQLQTSA